MKLVCAPMLALVATIAASIVSSPAQTSSPQTPAAPAQHQDQEQDQHRGQVIFSRSTDENGNTVTIRGPAAPPQASAPIATDAERQAVTFTSYDMDVHLAPAAQHIAVRALVTVRNDSKTPLAHVPLQISSSLNWERIRVGQEDATFQVATLNSDSDHTGQLHEAAVPLARPLAPGASLQLDVTYSGTIAQNAQRLVALGTPDDVAAHVNWDEIGVDFTGLRGFGNVAWYPVSSVPVILGDGARLFDEIGEQKLRMEGAHFRLRLTDEFAHGQAPTVAFINGRSVPLTITAGSEEVAGVARASLDSAMLGFQTPSLFAAVRKPIKAPVKAPIQAPDTTATDTTLWTLPTDETAANDWASAASNVMPFLEGWLGPHPHAQLNVLDLPDAEDAPAETGALVLSPIRQATDEQLEKVLVHGLAHAFLRTDAPSPVWLDEGLAYFMSTLWLEKQSGRTKALELLEADRPALALAEPSSPGEGVGQPLRQAISPIYYRTKAAYVFWMLRDLTSDAALAAALQAYDAAQDQARDQMQDQSKNGGPGEFEKLLEQASHRNLQWFFADWVDADKGLPDFTIDSVFPAPAQGGNILVGVNLSNSGYAAAEIPITVHTAETSITQRVLVPARSKDVRRILILGTPTEVEANDGTVPETEASIHVTKLTNPGDTPAAADGSNAPQ